MKRFLTLAAGSFLALHSMLSIAAEPQTTIPHSPKDLLATLPAAPAEWKIASSVAGGEFDGWLSTRATRLFRRVPPADSPESQNQAGGEVEVSVLDTAGYPRSLASFANFQPSKNGALEKHLIGSLPAITISDETGRRDTQVLVAARYLVEVTIQNDPKVRVEDWLRGMHFDALPAKPAPPTVARNNEVSLVYLDELHPEKNRKRSVSSSNTEALKKFLKSLPPSPPEEAPPGTASAPSETAR